MPGARRVAILIVAPSGFGQKLLEGIAGFKPDRGGAGGWSVTVHTDRAERLISVLERFDGDGVLCTVGTPGLLEAAEGRPYPIVNMAGRLADVGLPSVLGDEEAIGEAAGVALLDKGFERFAFVGSDAEFSLKRGRGFERAVLAAGHEPPVRLEAIAGEDGLRAWLTGVTHPAAVFAQDDYAGHAVLEVCRDAAVRVPEDVAVLGANDIDWLCELCDPPLSSVDTDLARRGRTAAALLERLMNGEAPPTAPIRIPPAGIVQRRSTDVIAVADPDLVAALRFIRERYHEPIRVEDVADHVLLSRRTLERRFADHFHRGLSQELWRVRVDAAKRLLLGSDLSILDVALRCGFTGGSVFSATFKRHTGHTPSQYRLRQHVRETR